MTLTTKNNNIKSYNKKGILTPKLESDHPSYVNNSKKIGQYIHTIAQ